MALNNIWAQNGSPVGPKVTYQNTVARIRNTPIGKRVMNFLDNIDFRFDVVVLREGAYFGQMVAWGDYAITAKSAYEEATGHDYKMAKMEVPTVFWCPSYHLDYFGDLMGVETKQPESVPVFRTRHSAWVENEYFYRANKIEKPVIRYTKARLPPWIVLFHELGHVWQYYEAAKNTRGHTWEKRCELAFSDIEFNNLRLHENPLCQISSLPRRRRYHDTPDSMGDFANLGYRNNNLFSPALRVAESWAQRHMDEVFLDEQAKYNSTNSSADGFHKAKPLWR